MCVVCVEMFGSPMVQKAPNVPFCALPKRDKLDGVQTSFPMAGDTYQAKCMCSIWTEGWGRVEGGGVALVGVAPPIRKMYGTRGSRPESCWITLQSSCVSQISAPTHLVRLDGLAFLQPVLICQWGGSVDQSAPCKDKEVRVYWSETGS